MANIMNKFNNKQKQPQANRCEERNKERGKTKKKINICLAAIIKLCSSFNFFGPYKNYFGENDDCLCMLTTLVLSDQ
jgi:hypothetical protein